MCKGCWLEAGSPTIINDRTKHAAALVAKVYEFSDVGGNAHVVVDDWNLETDSIERCLSLLETDPLDDSTPDQIEAERACLEALLALSMDERYSALAIFDRIINDKAEALKNLHAFLARVTALMVEFYVRTGYHPNRVVVPKQVANDLTTWHRTATGEYEAIGGIQTPYGVVEILTRPDAKTVFVEHRREIGQGRGMTS